MATRVALELEKLTRGSRHQRKWDMDNMKSNENEFHRSVEKDVQPGGKTNSKRKMVRTERRHIKKSKNTRGLQEGEKGKDAVGNRSHVCSR
jgi:hypothetical protein